MQKIGSWMRFRPTLRGSLNDTTVYEHDSIYAEARSIALDVLRSSGSRRYKPDSSLKRSARAVAKLRDKKSLQPSHLLAALVLQAPGAARAQREMDAHRGGYKNRQARLFELIDFNDTFVDTVLAIDDETRVTFVERLKAEIDFMCEYLHVDSFNTKQYEAIVHGLSREIAVFTGVKKLGYLARMTSRVQDAKGVDMIVTDPDTKKSLGIDIKTRSAYHFRLINLKRQNRINEEQRLACELAGFCTIVRKNTQGTSETLLFRIATADLGKITHFRFENLEPLRDHLARAFHDHGKYVIGSD